MTTIYVPGAPPKEYSAYWLGEELRKIGLKLDDLTTGDYNFDKISIGGHELYIDAGQLLVKAPGQDKGQTPSNTIYCYAGRNNGSHSFTVRDTSLAYAPVIDTGDGYLGNGIIPQADGFRFNYAGDYLIHLSMQVYRENGNSTYLFLTELIDDYDDTVIDFEEGGSGTYSTAVPFSVDMVSRWTVRNQTTMRIKIGLRLVNGTSVTAKIGRAQLYCTRVGGA